MRSVNILFKIFNSSFQENIYHVIKSIFIVFVRNFWYTINSYAWAPAICCNSLISFFSLTFAFFDSMICFWNIWFLELILVRKFVKIRAEHISFVVFFNKTFCLSKRSSIILFSSSSFCSIARVMISTTK